MNGLKSRNSKILFSAVNTILKGYYREEIDIYKNQLLNIVLEEEKEGNITNNESLLLKREIKEGEMVK